MSTIIRMRVQDAPMPIPRAGMSMTTDAACRCEAACTCEHHTKDAAMATPGRLTGFNARARKLWGLRP